MTRRAGKAANITVNRIGRKRKICACTGSVGGGDSACSAHIETPYMIGQAPMRSAPPRKAGEISNGKRPNRLKIEVGSRAERSWIQPTKGAWRISMVTESVL